MIPRPARPQNPHACHQRRIRPATHVRCQLHNIPEKARRRRQSLGGSQRGRGRRRGAGRGRSSRRSLPTDRAPQSGPRCKLWALANNSGSTLAIEGSRRGAEATGRGRRAGLRTFPSIRCERMKFIRLKRRRRRRVGQWQAVLNTSNCRGLPALQTGVTPATPGHRGGRGP